MANNSFRSVGAGTTFLSPTDFIVEVDTSAGAVTLILPKIATILSSYVTIQQYIGIRFIDVSNNASVNNITIAGFETDTINSENSITLDTNGAGGMLSLLGASQWNFVSNSNSSGGITEYKKSILPTTSTFCQTIPQPELWGEFYDLGSIFLPVNDAFVKLDNGHLADVLNCISVLYNGIYIYVAWDYVLDSPFWLAYKQNEQNPNLLEKVAELEFTTQKKNQGHDYTYKNSDNSVSFVGAVYPNTDTSLIVNYITTLTYSNGTLTAVDSVNNFGGLDTITLYNNLSGYAIPFGFAKWDVILASYILDDDYYGMSNGTQAGWCYYRDTNATGGAGTQWDCVGFNLLTGETKWVTPKNDIVANVTNFDFSGVDTNKFIINWINHPNGITFSFSNVQPVNNGSNLNGVTCIWSPFYQNPNEVIYFTQRNINDGTYDCVNGNLPKNWGFDNKNFYAYNYPTGVMAECIVMSRFNTDTKTIKSWVVPSYLPFPLGTAWFNAFYENNNGVNLLFTQDTNVQYYFGASTFFYFSNDDNYVSIQSNGNYYPTNVFGNKWYTYNAGLLNNTYNFGVEIDEFKNLQF